MWTMKTKTTWKTVQNNPDGRKMIMREYHFQLMVNYVLVKKPLCSFGAHVIEPSYIFLVRPIYNYDEHQLYEPAASVYDLNLQRS